MGMPEHAAHDREAGARAFEGRRREQTRARRRLGLARAHREGLHLVAERVGRAPVGEHDAEPEAAAEPSVDGERPRLACAGVQITR